MIQITSAKGSKLGYVHHAAEFTIVLWKSGESMTFAGPASVVFDKLIVDVDKSGVHCPKSLTKPANVRKEIEKYAHSILIQFPSFLTTEAFCAGSRQALDDAINGVSDRVWLLDFDDDDPYLMGYMTVIHFVLNLS